LRAGCRDAYDLRVLGRRNLKKHGVKGHAVVMDFEWHQSLLDKTRPVGVGDPDQRLTLTVTYEDGTQAEGIVVTVKHEDYFSSLGIGTRVPILYDAEDRSRVAVDVDAIKAKNKAVAAEDKRKAQAFAANPVNVEDAMAELDRKLAAGDITEDEWQSRSSKLIDDM
jgi:hypothetical protein